MTLSDRNVYAQTFAYALYLAGRGHTPIGAEMHNGKPCVVFPPAASAELGGFQSAKEILNEMFDSASASHAQPSR